MQRFRLMGCYVVLVVAALACAIEGIAIVRAAPGHKTNLVLRSMPTHANQ